MRNALLSNEHLHSDGVVEIALRKMHCGEYTVVYDM